ncbi:ABC transporter substrate-binding protein [Paenibacillus sp. Soil766]|uniref:extracellular solute-binding protein n=1 Tax=Paenibacillus sp. Soil766 TaxID=1736404 RepID=UPI00070A0FC4|nr:extracellular solute-binding protein [Paenibacillus sp. Soil766]KRE83975.1 ABC transporter substrate-binding protein [Paenibacillus sp. Soil766]
MKKKSVVMLATIMSMSFVMGACSKESSVATPSAASTAAATSSSSVPKAQTFKFLDYSNPSWPYDANWKVWGYLTEKTGVKLDIQLPPGNLLEDALAMTVASGDMPDLMWTQTKAIADKFGQQGALVNILDYVKDMPNLKAWMEKYPTEAQNVLSSDGKMYVFPNQGLGESNRRTWMYREDVFKKLGLAAPTNWDELYETLKKLKTAYPDSYPLTFRNGLRYMYDFGAGFNVPAEVEKRKASVFFDSASKDWKYAPIQNEYKTLLTYMNKFYKESLIPKDFLTIDTKMWQDIVSTNRAFVTLDYMGRIDFYNSALRKDNPQFTMNYMAPPAGWAGGPRKTAFTAVTEEGFMVSSKSKQIKEVMKYLDFFYSEEGKKLVSWGKEGETASGTSFTTKYADIADLRKKTGLSTDGAYTWFDFNAHISVSSPELQAAYKEAPKYDGEKNSTLSFTLEEQQILDTKGDSLNANRDENFSKFIMGTRNFSEWDKFIEEQKKLGYEEIVNIYRNADKRAKAAVKK